MNMIKCALQFQRKSNQHSNQMLVFDERGKPEYPAKNLSWQSRGPTNSIHIWHRVLKSNPGHIGGRQVLSPLGQPCHRKPFLTKQPRTRGENAMTFQLENVQTNEYPQFDRVWPPPLKNPVYAYDRDPLSSSKSRQHSASTYLHPSKWHDDPMTSEDLK